MDRGRSTMTLVGALAVSAGLLGVATPARARVPAGWRWKSLRNAVWYDGTDS